MSNKKSRRFFFFFVIVAIFGVLLFKFTRKQPTDEVVREITPAAGSIKTFISSTGTILPKNRLEIKPPVNGRIDRILVKEGDKVKTGQILAVMSSTERAALLDAARGKGEETLQYWEETYKPISLPAPIDGEVIVATTQPGQTVTAADAVVVLSDRLIVRAQVDETDIGKVKPGMKATINLDAYPDTKIDTVVGHIYYESKTVNNVTTYEVDLLPDEVPPFFRSGMNTTVDFIEKSKDNTLLVPAEAVFREGEESYVFLKQGSEAEPLKTRVTAGITDDKNVEILSGLSEKDTIVIKEKKYRLPKDTTGKNPFMPGRRR